MAVNVPVVPSADGPYPQPFPGETFLLTRDKIAFSFKDATRNVSSVRGRLFMTNLRMVFRIDESDRVKASCDTFEMPFRGLWDERLNQPIFGTNNLTATLMYYDEQPFAGELSVKLIFKEGGVGTFLAVFNNVLRATRIQLNRERLNPSAAEPAPIPSADPSASAPEARTYMPSEQAFVDPNDPSRIYTTTQPELHDNRRRTEAPSWSVSGAGLRRR